MIASAPRYSHARLRNDKDGLSVALLRKLKLKRLGTLGRFKVYVVDGKFLRDRVDIDFTCGGNPARYGYTPKNELWVEGREDEWAATALHEYVETVLMYLGDSYNKAHDSACQEEKRFRAAHPRGGTLRTVDIWLGDNFRK